MNSRSILIRIKRLESIEDQRHDPKLVENIQRGIERVARFTGRPVVEPKEIEWPEHLKDDASLVSHLKRGQWRVENLK